MRVTPCALLLAALLTVACDGAPSQQQLAEDGQSVLASLGDLVDTLAETHTAEAVRSGVDGLVTELGVLKQRAADSSRAVVEDPDVQAALRRTREALEEVERRLRGVVEDEELKRALDDAATRLRAQLQGQG